ncbi:unnamed protein product [Dovyalis caffra]|uniref:Uncharacterized protein n=1 Tax=Dovyalis caffra TaxID=77055 RepID=A0AAV1R0I7_9ROSI|nr:unnamed protein product [Dovyalis caffra]
MPERTAINVVKPLTVETIAEKRDVTKFFSNTFCSAYMGCSVGPNTFYCVEIIFEAVNRKFISEGLASDQMPEFQVFFNDLVFNDFNTLFSQLLPEFSLHFVHSSYLQQWLSQVPEELQYKESPAWNKGRIHYTNAPGRVVSAFAPQFAKGMGMFFEARAKELVEGGMVVLIMSSIPDGNPDPVFQRA